MFTMISTVLLMWAGYAISRSIVRQRQIEFEHKIMMRRERNKQVYLFRLMMINRFGHKIDECMPEYAEMLESDKPLVAKEWVKIDELVNLN